MRLFEQKLTYLYGKIHGCKFITPMETYKIEKLNVSAGMHPARYRDGVEIFYVAPIFNSYLASREENVCILFSVDGKMTITRDDVSEGVLYTFKILRETDDLREAEIYKSNALHPGFRTRGEMKWKDDENGNRRCFVETKYGEGYLVPQNNREDTSIEVLLFKKGRHLHFVQVGDPVSGVVSMTVSGELCGGRYLVKDRNVKGLMRGNGRHAVGDVVKCVVKEVNLGSYLFDEYVELKAGDLIEAKVKRYEKKKICVEYEGKEGYVVVEEGKRRRYGDVVRGIVCDVESNVFVMKIEKKEDASSRDKCLNNKQDGNEESFKKHKEQKKREMRDRNGYIRSRIDLSVPFDIEDVLDQDVAEVVVEDSKTLGAERKRKSVMNEDDIVMEIKAHPGLAMPVIKHMQYKIEIDEHDAPRQIFDEHVARMEGDEKDKLCIAYVNYLVFANDEGWMKTVSRLSKICSPKFLEVVALNTDEEDVLKLYFEEDATRRSFGMYLEKLLKENENRGIALVESHLEFLPASIGLIYKYCGNPRMIVERLITDRKDVWIAYIKNESGVYLRSLYRRVVEKKWKVKDMKDFYKMWLEYEKENSGNVEEVKLRAQEYVDKVKKGQC
ncbi:hypothetical protein HK407_06g11020 [Ordospora pajunii]|uniref:uncharacterized protein n=1 Tax=Ordospora pajunii TaxID=3039483 RepID=UPI0029528BF6|nr:uncharacterized protein HK407_06g11020 [Ordospora pajunii]KAH9411272.1 hypothetical protein HK407_06g11020 [Ordospora pajunii]